MPDAIEGFVPAGTGGDLARSTKRPADAPDAEATMNATLSRISLATLAGMTLAGPVSARDGVVAKKSERMTGLRGFKPAYQTHSRVSGTERPYTWPVADRYSPVAKPYFGRAY